MFLVHKYRCETVIDSKTDMRLLDYLPLQIDIAEVDITNVVFGRFIYIYLN
jgi:hypothetical protein